MIDDEFLSQFPSMYDTNILGKVIPMKVSIERCKHNMRVLEAEEYMNSPERAADQIVAKDNGEVLTQRKTKDGTLKTYNPLHAKNLRSQNRMR